MIEFNRGNALFKNRDQEQALDRYLLALATDDPALASRAKYNIGVIKYRQALAAAQKYEDALTLAQAAIGYFRDSLRLDPGHADARYNLELAYRFHYRLEQDLLHAQRNAASPEDKTVAAARPGAVRQDQERGAASATRAPTWTAARTASAPTRCPRTTPTTKRKVSRRRWRACRSR